MRITRIQLRRLIKEELARVMIEGDKSAADVEEDMRKECRAENESLAGPNLPAVKQSMLDACVKFKLAKLRGSTGA